MSTRTLSFTSSRECGKVFKRIILSRLSYWIISTLISLLYINNLHLMQESLFPRSSDEDKDIIHRMVSLVFLSRSGFLHKLSQFFQSFWPNPCKKQIEKPVSNTRILFQFPLILMHLLLCIHIRMFHFLDVLLCPSWFVFMTLSILE